MGSDHVLMIKDDAFNAAIYRLCCVLFFLRCGGLGVRETGRDVEGGVWPIKFGNRCSRPVVLHLFSVMYPL